MKAIITGMNGTVAPALARQLRDRDFTVTAWDRSLVPTDDEDACERFIREERPDWFFQVATGSPVWIECTARICRENGIRLLHTGSVSVFDGSKPGPFPVDHATDAADEYGRYKADCERRVRTAHPDAVIARLGWQIGDAPGSNNMIDFLQKQQMEHGHIEASTGWIPSCAFLEDTAAALVRLTEKDFAPGTYQLEGNLEAMSFYDLVTALNLKHGGAWNVKAKQEPGHDIRMLEDRITMPPLSARLQNG